ncbi:pyridoxamine 5'-phosphate oxidase, FMN-binding family [compost metagenome]
MLYSQSTSDETAIELLDKDGARALVESFPPPSALVVGAVLDHLDDHFRSFIAQSPLCFVSSCDENGLQEVSPRGDPSGAFRVIDEKRLAIADRPGNNRVDTLKNLLVNPQIGLIFLVPGIEHTLRISGKARISVDKRLLALLSLSERLAPRLAIVVEVEKAHLHCAKAFRRSRIWEVESHAARESVPSFTKTIADQVKMAEERRSEFEARIARNNVEGLWEGRVSD